MTPETTDLDWVAERLPDVPAPDGAITDRARLALMEHLSAATPITAPARSRRPKRSRRLYRRPLSLGLVAAAAAAGAFAIVNVTSGGGHDSIGSANAATIVAHARSALTAVPGQVLEWTVSGPDGPTTTMAVDGASPQDFVTTLQGHGTNEILGQESGMIEFYDPASNTIYQDSDTARAETVSPGGLADNVETNAQTVVKRNTTLNGAPATTITGRDASGVTYELWVDPSNGDRPLQLIVTPTSGTPITGTWSGYQTVTPSASSPSPALLTARYPSATVKTLSDADYIAIGHRTDNGSNGS